MKNNFAYQLGIVREGVYIYSPVFMYLFLKMREIFGTNNNDVDNIVSKISGLSCGQWPQQYQEDFEKLFILDEKLVNLQREFIYFSIFIFSEFAFNYIDKNDQEKKEFTLDYLFEIFKDNRKPWFIKPPSQDAYNKYRNSDNPILVLHNEISKVSEEKDVLFLADFVIVITSIVKFYIGSTVKKVFE